VKAFGIGRGGKINLKITGEITKLRKGLEQITGSLGVTLDGILVEITRKESGLSISGKKGKYRIAYEKKSDFFRALAILNGKLKQGEDKVSIYETRKLETCGVMFDCSRNAVLKPEAFKDILCKMACMGLNTAMLYTEDTYEIEGYPYFGYMRGAYTKEELKDLDAYAAALGIELIPCIQTLGHLRMALRWPFANNIKDRPDILLADEPETYRFIDAMLKTCRECFSSNKIHIGMDEAHDVGMGRYLDIHGFQNRFKILSRHLSKVTEMAVRYGLKPMMWSDMFFRLGSKTGDYYDLDATVPSDLPEKIPGNVSLVYWDYYHNTPDFYRTMLKEHKKMKHDVIFAGGIWTWQGMGINYRKTFQTSNPALQSCYEAGIKEVFATVWEDDGAEVNVYAALLGMQLYAEYAYNEKVTESLLFERFKLCTGYNAEVFAAFEIDDYPVEWCHNGEALNVSKQVLWQDPLLGLFDKNFEGIDLKGHYAAKLKKIQNIKKVETSLELEKLFDYYEQLLIVIGEKCDMGIRITKAYISGDETALQLIIKDLRELYNNIEDLHIKFSLLWRETNKAFGFERIDLRFGGLLARIKVAERKLENYINGYQSSIEELEIKKLMFDGEMLKPGKSLTNCQNYEVISTVAAGSGF
jgi:hypothetical protein